MRLGETNFFIRRPCFVLYEAFFPLHLGLFLFGGERWYELLSLLLCWRWMSMGLDWGMFADVEIERMSRI